MTIDEMRQWEELFSCPKYKELVEMATLELEGLKMTALWDASDINAVCTARGQAHQLDALINLEQVVIQQIQMDNQEAEEDDTL